MSRSETDRERDRAIGAAIRAMRDEKGMSLAAVEKETGMHRSLIARKERGEVSTSHADREMFAKAYGVRLEELEDRWAPPATGSAGLIPVLNCGPAGAVLDYEWRDPSNEVVFKQIDSTGIDHRNVYAVKVVGPSMEPTLFAGDLVVFQPVVASDNRTPLNDGAVVMVSFGPENETYPNAATIARYYSMSKGRVRLHKDNARHPDMVVPREAIKRLSVGIEARTRRLSHN